MDAVRHLRAADPTSELGSVLRTLIAGATRELVALLPAEHPVADGLRIALRDRRPCGVGVRVVHDGGGTTPFPEPAIVRTVDRVPQAIVVVDRAVALLSPRAPWTPPTIVDGAAVVQACATAFAGMWAFSQESMDAAPVRDGDVLRALGGGSTDECAARELNISTRTYRRRVAELMAQLGASSRFQAGALAAGRGWVDGGRRPG
ncbi:hypothetical protein [Pseudonocardia hydrocarbonoxydans]|uniref:HTH luxR-type domain-containing protein n=1 Tax=Pseudonocardia hydrocarbonoxydans TaxID=76726 RepID=A0A4Y3WT27_9PSEU|nr:hypothetical protein [Pseudonocardia hydrocarbonoxydans]GEC22025.1 hypothetical protein PHY01_43080 [Pseudonocardia hydrocarbonoxydans]